MCPLQYPSLWSMSPWKNDPCKTRSGSVIFQWKLDNLAETESRWVHSCTATVRHQVPICLFSLNLRSGPPLGPTPFLFCPSRFSSSTRRTSGLSKTHLDRLFVQLKFWNLVKTESLRKGSTWSSIGVHLSSKWPRVKRALICYLLSLNFESL